MLSCPCPHCGKPIPIVLHAAWGRCTACGRQGPLPPEIMAEVMAASAIVARGAARERQIRGSLRAVVARGQSYGVFTALLGVVGVAPIGLFTAVMMLGLAVGDDSTGDAFMASAVLLGLLASLALVVFATRLVMARQRALEHAFSAVPPAAPGEAAACHVCGGELAARAEGVVRCTYCAADNIVRPAALAKLESTRAVAFASIGEAVTRRLAELEQVTFSAGVISFVGALIAPLGVGIVALMVAVVYSLQSHPADPAVAYVIVQENGRACVGALKTKGDDRIVAFGATRRPELPSSRPLRPGEDTKILHAADFVGMRLEGAHQRGVVLSVQADLISGNAAVIETTRSLPLLGACVWEQEPAQP